MERSRIHLNFYIDVSGTKEEIKETVEDVVSRTLFEFTYLEPVLEPNEIRSLDDDTSKYETYSLWEEK
tara:strand:+ start:3939 stop:4142 length:204 start_codon:yes stop_codon:yes gene_type:complete